MQIILTALPGEIASAFVADPEVVSEVGRILPIMTCVFFIMGPLMMLAAYFQAIGSATLAAILGLTKPYVFAIPLTFLLALRFGEVGVWYAGPVAEILLLGLSVFVLSHRAKQTQLRLGLFHTSNMRTGEVS